MWYHNISMSSEMWRKMAFFSSTGKAEAESADEGFIFHLILFNPLFKFIHSWFNFFLS